MIDETTKKDFKKLRDLARQPLKTERELKTVEIVMLKFHDEDSAKVATSKILEHSDWPYKLTIYNNEFNTPNISKIWNKLIKESTCDYVLIMDSDVYVNEKWLSRMMKTFEEYKDCMLVLPCMERTSGPQQIEKEEKQGVEKLNTIFAAQCVLYKKELFEKVGYFDEDFVLYGQDSEFADRLLKSSIVGYIRKDVFVDHIGSYSIDSNFEKGNIKIDKQIERNYARELYRFKSGRNSR